MIASGKWANNCAVWGQILVWTVTLRNAIYKSEPNLIEWPTITMHMLPQFLTHCMVALHLRHLISSRTILGRHVYG